MGVGGAVTYKSAAGYNGEDAFVFAVTGQMKTGRGTAKIRVKVSVQDAGISGGSGAKTVQAPRSVVTTVPDKERSVRRECLRKHGSMYDPQRRVWLLDQRYSQFFWNCLARGMGVAHTR